MEDNIFDRKISTGFVDKWFDLKKDVLRIERFFTRQLFMFKDFLKFAEKSDDFSSLVFNNMISDIQFALLTAEGMISRIDSLHNYYMSVKNEKLNKNIYMLTVFSGLFLPLNLIVGFFGMNTEGMLFANDPKGTTFVIYALMSVFIIFLVGFNILKFLDKFLLRWWLSRRSIYKKFLQKIDKLEEKWRV